MHVAKDLTGVEDGAGAKATAMGLASPFLTARSFSPGLMRHRRRLAAIAALLVSGLIVVGVALLWPAQRPIGVVEAARIVGDKLELQGWAFDFKARSEPATLYVLVGGRVAAHVTPAEVRREGMGTGKVVGTFRIELDKTMVDGKARPIAVYATTEDGLRELAYSRGLAVPLGGEDRRDRLTLVLDRAELALMATNSEYRRKAGAPHNTGRTGVIAGASAAG